jgi:hypothetical protein
MVGRYRRAIHDDSRDRRGFARDVFVTFVGKSLQRHALGFARLVGVPYVACRTLEYCAMRARNEAANADRAIVRGGQNSVGLLPFLRAPDDQVANSGRRAKRDAWFVEVSRKFRISKNMLL